MIGVVLNGEVYNLNELREQLIRDGHELGNRGDTDVIALLAEDRGAPALARWLDGMFALAVWDRRR
jgi:asparagine synthase (glutamine-hydrolysing)